MPNQYYYFPLHARHTHDSVVVFTLLRNYVQFVPACCRSDTREVASLPDEEEENGFGVPNAYWFNLYNLLSMPATF